MHISYVKCLPAKVLRNAPWMVEGDETFPAWETVIAFIMNLTKSTQKLTRLQKLWFQWNQLERISAFCPVIEKSVGLLLLNKKKIWLSYLVECWAGASYTVVSKILRHYTWNACVSLCVLTSPTIPHWASSCLVTKQSDGICHANSFEQK